MNKNISKYQKIILLGILVTVFIFSIPSASADSWEDHRDTSWTRGAISTPEQLAQFAYLVNTGDFEGTDVYLTKDIDLDGHEWVPIGDYLTRNVFGGNFDGKSHIINNMTITATQTGNHCFMGLFGYSAAEIENITIKGKISYTGNIANTKITTGIGGIAGYSTGNITNCTSYVNITTSNTGWLKLNIGGISGYSYGNIMCGFYYGDITTDGGLLSSFVGGITGLNGYNTTYPYGGHVKYSVNEGNITHSGTANSAFFGGICGRNTGNIDQCANLGNITGNYFEHYCVGGIAAESFNDSNNRGNITNSYNQGKLETGIGKNVTAGGIAGNFTGVLMENCYNTGDLTGDRVGGIIGTVNRPDLSKEIINCYFIENSDYGLSNYHNQNVSNNPESDRGIKNTSDEMKDPDYVNLLNENGIIIFGAVDDDYPVFV